MAMSIETQLNAFKGECDLIAAKATSFRDTALERRDPSRVNGEDTLGLLNEALHASFRQMAADLEAINVPEDRPPPDQGHEP
jgi:hypothetical protein